MASKHHKKMKPDRANNQTEANGSSANTVESSESKSDPDMFDGVHRSILEAFDNLDWDDDTPYEEKKDLIKYWKPPDAKSVSYTLKLVDEDKVQFLTKQVKMPPWNGDDNGNQSYYLPGLKPNHHTILPKRSVLNGREQNQLYTFYNNMTYRTKHPLTEEQLATFQELRTRVAGEYAEFQEFAKSEWCKGQWKRVLEIPPQVDSYIDSLWKMRAGQCLTLYPDDYRSVKQIPLSLHDPNKDFSVFKFANHVFTKSLPTKVSLLRTKRQITLISDFDDLNRLKPVSSDYQNCPKPLMQPIPRVSADTNVYNILTSNDLDIDVVISMSGIKTIIDNIKFQREWVLPIVVKEVVKNDGDTVKKVVIIDKNLPPKCLSVHEKNVWHAKIVAKWMLVKSDFPHILEKDNPSSQKSSESYDDMLSEVVKKLKVDKVTGKEEVVREPKKKGPEPMFENPEPKFKNPEPKFKRPEPKFMSPEPKFMSPPPPLTPGLRGKSDASGARPVAELSPNNFESRKRGRESLSYGDDPFADDLVQDFEEFGVDHAPIKNVRNKDKKETDNPKQHPKDTACSNISGGNNAVKKTQSPRNEVRSGSLERNNINAIGNSTSSVERKIANPSAGPMEKNLNEIAGNPNATFERKFLKPSFVKRGLARPCLQYDVWKLEKSNYIQFLKGEQRSLNVLVRTRIDGKLFHYEDNKGIYDDVCVSSKLEFQPEYGASKMATSEVIREYLDLYMRPNSKLVRVRSIGHTKEVMMNELKTLKDVKNVLQQEVRDIQRLFDPLYAVLTKLIDLPAGRYMLQHKAKDAAFATLMVEAPGCASFNLPSYCQGVTMVEVNVPPMPIDPLVLSPLQHRDRLAPALFTPFHKEQGPAFFSRPRAPMRKRKKKGWKEKKKNKIEPPPPPPSDDESCKM